MNSLNILGYEVFCGKLANMELHQFQEKTIFSTINAHSYTVAKKDKIFRRAIISSTYILPDGSSIVLAAKLLKNVKLLKISGFDIHLHLLNELNKRSGSVFYLGSTNTTLNKIKAKIRKDFKNISIGQYSPPFKTEFSKKENNEIIGMINNFSPDVLFIGMTAPKQEKWLFLNQNKLKFKVGVSIGAVFDFYSGNKRRANKLLISIHMEWLYRFIQEPKRLWKRIFISNFVILKDILKEKINDY